MTGPRPWPVKVFAVDDTSVQLTWRASPAQGLCLRVGEATVMPAASAKVPLLVGRHRRPHTLDPAWPGGPGAVTVEGLAPGRTYEIVASAEGVPEHVVGRAHTLGPPQGPELCRFATVSDVHIGERHFGVLGRLYDAQRPYYPYRALAAALDEAVAWGAQLMVVKGDLTRRTTPAELRDVARLLRTCAVPVEAVMGNHDHSGRVNARAILAHEGLDVPWGPRAVDLPGVRLVMVDSVHADAHKHRGQVPRAMAERIAGLVAASPQPAWVTMHHPPEMHPYPLAYPPGVPFGESQVLLDALAGTGRPVMVSAGHRHRNRRHRHGPVEVTEVGSTKDYPGVWAGYKVFEGGFVQVVRRVARPDVITWTEVSRRAMNGQWGRWAPGRLGERCFSWSWSS